VEVAVLRAGLALHGPIPGLRLGVAVRLGEHGAAGREQRAHAVLAASSVHVGAVLAAHVERAAVHLDPLLGGLQPRVREHLVEELLPRAGVDPGGVRDHAVHVEDHGGEAGAQHVHRFRRRGVGHAGHGGGERGGGKNVHGAGTPRAWDEDLERVVRRARSPGTVLQRVDVARARHAREVRAHTLPVVHHWLSHDAVDPRGAPERWMARGGCNPPNSPPPFLDMLRGNLPRT